MAVYDGVSRSASQDSAGHRRNMSRRFSDAAPHTAAAEDADLLLSIPKPTPRRIGASRAIGTYLL
ncbi:hypothetical protein GCM10009834_06760 [Streptomonospora arabica]